MPVTKTAKRALRAAKRKALINKLIISRLEVAIRTAKKTKTKEATRKAVSLADRAHKKKFIHANRAARIKSSLALLSVKKVKSSKKK